MQVISVQPNNTTTLSVSMSPGASITNTDPVNAVWLDDTPGVAPGYGLRLGPKGSTNWTAPTHPVYACTDTGVTSPVTVTISDTMQDTNNPVDIGVAVSQQLLANGVPNVLTGKVLFSQANPPLIAAAQGDNVICDTSGYASIMVTISNKNIPVKITCSFADEYRALMTERTYHMTVGNRSLKLQIPVTGPKFVIKVSTADPLANLHIYGSNRTTVEKVTARTPITNYSTGTVAWTAGQIAALTDMTTDGGLTQIRWVVGGTGTGQLGVYNVNEDGTLNAIALLDTNSPGAHTSTVSGTEVHTQIITPPGNILFLFIARTAASYIVQLSAVPIS